MGKIVGIRLQKRDWFIYMLRKLVIKDARNQILAHGAWLLAKHGGSINGGRQGSPVAAPLCFLIGNAGSKHLELHLCFDFCTRIYSPGSIMSIQAHRL
jgi:hypothetical protein